MTAPIVRCRYLAHHDERCTAEATMPDGDVLLCIKHMARAIAVLDSVGYTVLPPASSRQPAAVVVHECCGRLDDGPHENFCPHFRWGADRALTAQGR